MKTNTVYDSFGHRYSISPHKILMCCTTATILLFRLPEGFPPPTGRVHSARPREIQHMPPSLGLYNSCNEPGFSGCGLLFPFVRVCVYFINFYWSIVALQRCVSAVQQSESAIRINISPLFWTSHLGHHRAPSRVPCGIQQVLISYLFYTRYQ